LFAERVEKLQKIMRDNAIGALFLHPGVNTYYFTGMMKPSYERLLTIIIPESGDAIAVVPGFEVEAVRKSSKISFRDIEGFKEDEDPCNLVSKTVQELGKTHSTVAIDGRMEYMFFHGIQKALPEAHFEDASTLLREMRLFKSTEEVQMMRKAAHIVCRGIKAAFESAAVGRTEMDLLGVLQNEIRKQGGAYSGGAIISGPISALPHGQTSEKKIKRGEIILADIGGLYQWYFGDVTRTTVLGKPTEKQKKIYSVVLEAQKTACKAVKPGIEAQELDRIARKIITDAGYGQYFTHRLGHGLGLEVHEGPFIVEGNSLQLQPGMVHSVEPGIYLEGEFGVRIEDDVAVTEEGGDNLSARAFPKDELISL
jgi:Xaa-Pro aminopeptidase